MYLQVHASTEQRSIDIIYNMKSMDEIYVFLSV